MPDLPPTSADRAPSGSVDPAYFERLYAERADPWDYETSAYEAAKYRATLDALPHPRYARALEIGCAIGVLTEQLAARCDWLLATDVSDEALARARERCADCEHVTFERRVLPAAMPDGPFDLVVLSEVGYYWTEPDLRRARSAIAERLAPGGHLLLVHWTEPTDYPLTGDAVHDCFLAWCDTVWTLRHAARHAQYRLDLLERLPTAVPAS